MSRSNSAQCAISTADVIETTNAHRIANRRSIIAPSDRLCPSGSFANRAPTGRCRRCSGKNKSLDSCFTERKDSTSGISRYFLVTRGQPRRRRALQVCITMLPEIDDELVARMKGCDEPHVLEPITRAILNKGITLGQLSHSSPAQSTTSPRAQPEPVRSSRFRCDVAVVISQENIQRHCAEFRDGHDISPTVNAGLEHSILD